MLLSKFTFGVRQKLQDLDILAVLRQQREPQRQSQALAVFDLCHPVRVALVRQEGNLQIVESIVSKIARCDPACTLVSQ